MIIDSPLRRGRPPGRWNFKIITPERVRDKKNKNNE